MPCCTHILAALTMLQLLPHEAFYIDRDLEEDLTESAHAQFEISMTTIVSLVLHTYLEQSLWKQHIFMAYSHLANQKYAFPCIYAHAYMLAHITCMCPVSWRIFSCTFKKCCFRFSCFILCTLVFYLHVYLCIKGILGAFWRDQNRELDPLELELQVVLNHCECWESRLGPMQEQLVLLTTEPSF